MKTGEKLSQKTILHHYRLISVILQQATRERIIKHNPASKDYMRIPKVNKKEIQCLQIQDVEKLLIALIGEDKKMVTAVKLLLFNGIRRGELCGLEWQDIDFEKKTLTISRSSLYTAAKGIYTKEPKTKSSIRTFSVSDSVLAIFYDYLSWYKKEYGYCCDESLSNKRLFITKNKKPIHPDTITDWTSKLYKKKSFRNTVQGKYKFYKL
jgi:integrase